MDTSFPCTFFRFELRESTADEAEEKSIDAIIRRGKGYHELINRMTMTIGGMRLTTIAAVTTLLRPVSVPRIQVGRRKSIGNLKNASWMFSIFSNMVSMSGGKLV